jgi:hypothetical protein
MRNAFAVVMLLMAVGCAAHQSSLDDSPTTATPAVAVSHRPTDRMDPMELYGESIVKGPKVHAAAVGDMTYFLLGVYNEPYLGPRPSDSFGGDNYLVVSLSAYNRGNRPFRIPVMPLVDRKGRVYEQSDDGWLLDDSIVIHPMVNPGQPGGGRVAYRIHDAVASDYRIVVGVGAGGELISIPLGRTNDWPTTQIANHPD